MAWSDIAASAYRAYAASTGNKNFRGEPMPVFVDLPRPIQVAWEAAVRHACGLAAMPFQGEVTESHLADLENKWADWTPRD
jgi:hypothetical protein